MGPHIGPLIRPLVGIVGRIRRYVGCFRHGQGTSIPTFFRRRQTWDSKQQILQRKSPTVCFIGSNSSIDSVTEESKVRKNRPFRLAGNPNKPYSTPPPVRYQSTVRRSPSRK